ncbi:2089_t:CDS:1, partial [Ambispora leptoticha]
MLIDRFPLIDVIACCFGNRSIFGFRRPIVVHRENFHLLVHWWHVLFFTYHKQDIDAKHNSELDTRDTARDTMFNEILANRDARIATELTNRDARFITELIDYRVKFNAELTSRDEKFTAEVQRIFTMFNTSTARLDEIER